MAAYAETNRIPFDLPEAETELVAGYHTEYSSMKFAMFFMSEYANMITVACLATLLFFGGWHGPFVWTCIAALVVAGVLVRREGFLFSLSLYLGAWDVAALPLRPTDVFRLEVSIAAGDCESGGNGDCRSLVTRSEFSVLGSQFSVTA